MKPLEIRKASGSVVLGEPADGTKHSGPRLVGYGAVYNSKSLDLGGFVEVIQPGAFRDSLRTREVRALYAHDDHALLGRTRNGTLELREDAKGLRFSLRLPNTTLGRDIAALVGDGTLSQMSFGFSVAKDGDAWTRERGQMVRVLKKVNLSELSIVATPAYEETSVSLREAVAALDSAIAQALADRRRRLAELVR
ncbi:MAG: HK97 family phage prohead protease [Nitrospira sp.]|nr:HK97 family phage prohead protease [Nitrospira sp.]